MATPGQRGWAAFVCKAVEEGGQRCSSHTRRAEKKNRKRLAAAQRGGEQTAIRDAEAAWLEAATAYASTDTGHSVLTERQHVLTTDGHLHQAALLGQALKRGRDMQEANRVAAAAIREAREQQARQRRRADDYDKALSALAQAWTD